MTGRPKGGPTYGPPRGQAPTFSPFSPVRPAGPWGPGIPGSPLEEVSIQTHKQKTRKASTQPLPQKNPKAPSPEVQGRLVHWYQCLVPGDPREEQWVRKWP